MTDTLSLPIVLTPEQEALRSEIHTFAAEVIRPAAIELDKLSDPEDVIREGSVLWDVMRQTFELGYHRQGFPEELGGTPMGPVEGLLVSEEMAWGSVDLSISTGLASFPFTFAAQSGNQELIERYVIPFLEDTEAKYVGCWAITEPNHGSDTLLTTDPFWRDPKVTCNVQAELDGDEWILRGQKSGWVSNGTFATHALVYLTIDPTRGMAGGGVAFVPLGLPGVSRGKPTNKLGQRALNQGEIFFDEVRIPRHYMLVDPDGYEAAVEGVLTGANAGMGVIFSGVARAAYEEALAYSRERVQGGKPICEHQLVQKKLFDMFTKVQATRQLSFFASLRASSGEPSLQYSIAAKTFCTQAAFEVASDAVQLHGGYGVTKDAFVEKLFRDARSSLIEDGSNDVLALLGAGKILQQA